MSRRIFTEKHRNNISKSHRGKSYKTYRTITGFKFYTIPDLCWCGCGETCWNRGQRYKSGHNYPTKNTNEKYSYIFKELWKNEEHIKKMSDKLKHRWKDTEQRKELLHPPWNKGRHDICCGKDNPFYGKTHTKETRNKISSSREGKTAGENHPNWQGGISFKPYCKKFNYKLKEVVRNRDDRTCQLCNIKEVNRKHGVHHIHYDKENCYPDLITLCSSCNCKFNFNRKYYENLFMNKLNDRHLLFWTIRYEEKKNDQKK